MPSKLIRVSSKHNIFSDTKSNFSVNIGSSNPFLHQARGISLVSAMIPNKWYNVNEYNNVITANYNAGGETDYTIPEGQYTVTSLMSYLESIWSGTTITEDATTQLINIATDGATTLDVYSQEDKSNSTLAEVIGLETSITLGISSNADMDVLPSLQGLEGILVHLDLARQNMISSQENSIAIEEDVIAVIPIPSSVDFGYTVTWQDNGANEGSRVTFHDTQDVTQFNIKFTDLNNNFIDLQGQITLVFRVYY